MESKRYLLQRAGATCGDRTEKQSVRDVLKSLLPQVRNFCQKKIKDPSDPDAKKKFLDTLEGLERLLECTEQCLYEDRKVLAIAQQQLANGTAAPAPVTMVTTDHAQDNNAAVTNLNSNKNREHQDDRQVAKKVTDFERQVLNKLDALSILCKTIWLVYT